VAAARLPRGGTSCLAGGGGMTTRRGLAVLLVTWLLLLAVGAAAWCDDSMLTVVQDEGSMERVIERYLKDKHQLIIEEKTSTSDPEDLYLELPFKGDPMPKFRMTIDSQSLNRNQDTGRIIERGVLLNLYTDVRVPADKRGAALVVINDFNRRKAFCSAYVDTDGEVVCSWILNVLPDVGLPTEAVYDAVARVQNIWKAIYPDLANAIK
jgi:hypothetical protein